MPNHYQYILFYSILPLPCTRPRVTIASESRYASATIPRKHSRISFVSNTIEQIPVNSQCNVMNEDIYFEVSGLLRNTVTVEKRAPIHDIASPQTTRPPSLSIRRREEIESHLFLGSSSLLSLSLRPLLADAHETSVAASQAQTAIGRLLTLGHVAALDVGNGVLGGGVLDGEGGAEVIGITLGSAVGGEGGFGGVDLVSGGVELLELAALPGEEDQTGLVVVETGDVGSQRFLGVVVAAVVDGDADGGGKLLGDAGFLCTSKSCCFMPTSSPGIYTFNSARENPRPARTRRLYLLVGQWTTGRSLSTGRGATEAAFAARASRRLCLRPGYAKLVHCPCRRSHNVASISTRIRRKGGYRVPGRSTRARGASSPCGSLQNVSHWAEIGRRRGHSRWLII